jgi:hypothetical protein
MDNKGLKKICLKKTKGEKRFGQPSTKAPINETI